jgi:hypothetical protein
MRQRTINWAGALRDMQRHRSPEKRLMDEMVDALKQTTQTLEALCMLKGIDPSQSRAVSTARAVIAKAEARNA